MDEKIAERFRYWRRRGAGDERIPLTAEQALSYARWEAAAKALEIDWDFSGHDGRGGAFVRGTLDINGRTVDVYVGDDSPVDWGDIEPTEREAENASSYWIGADCEGFEDSIGGVDVIDLPGYLQRDWEDAARFALLEYLLPELLPKVERETAERAEWAARDTVTVA